jgi:hypothetical protein
VRTGERLGGLRSRAWSQVRLRHMAACDGASAMELQLALVLPLFRSSSFAWTCYPAIRPSAGFHIFDFEDREGAAVLSYSITPHQRGPRAREAAMRPSSALVSTGQKLLVNPSLGITFAQPGERPCQALINRFESALIICGRRRAAPTSAGKHSGFMPNEKC